MRTLAPLGLVIVLLAAPARAQGDGCVADRPTPACAPSEAPASLTTTVAAATLAAIAEADGLARSGDALGCARAMDALVARADDLPDEGVALAWRCVRDARAAEVSRSPDRATRRGAARGTGAARAELDAITARIARLVECRPPSTGDEVTASYAIARVAAEGLDLGGALARSRAIALDHPDHEVAPYAASLWLDTANRIASEDPARREACVASIAAALDPLAARYCAPAGAHPELCETLEALRCAVAHAEAERLGAAGRPSDAADALVVLADAGACGRHDEDLWNAAVHARRGHDLDRALALFERLATAFPASPLAPRALHEIARVEHARARYPEAASAYERLARLAPAATCADAACPDAPAALARAIELRIALGELDAARRDRDEHARLFGRSRPTDSARLALEVALALERAARPREAARMLALPPTSELPVDLAIEMLVARARLDPRRASGHDDAIALWERHRATLGARDEDRAARARARHAIGEAFFARTDPRLAAIVSARAPSRELGPWITARQAELAELERALAPIAALEDPRWILASLERLAAAHHALADAVAARDLHAATALRDAAHARDRACAERVIALRTPSEAGLRCVARALPPAHELAATASFAPDAVVPPRLPEPTLEP